MSLQDLPRPSSDRPWDGWLWTAVLEEAREVAWLLALVGGLSAAGVGLAVLLAGA